MSGRSWLQERRVWLPALVLLGLNLVAYAVYAGFFADETRTREARLEQTRETLTTLRAEAERAQALAKRTEANQRRIARLYRERFKTQEQRLTKMIAEVKKLAKDAGLDPPVIRYPDQTFDNLGLVKRSIVFGVEGSYVSLRKFVNFLELTNSFLILEELRPTETDSPQRNATKLRIDLHVSTLFLEDGLNPELLARDRTAAREALNP